MNAYLTSPAYQAGRLGKQDHSRGFSLLEVLVALLVIAFGLLGIAGMQAISMSNTNVSGSRSVAAMEAASMAAAMSANEQYWQSASTMPLSTGNFNASIVGSSVTINSNPQTTPSCLGAICLAASDMAVIDMQNWGNDLLKVLPDGQATISCNKGNVSGQSVITCTITVTWVEKSMAQNQVGGVSGTAGTPYDYTLVIQP